MTFNAKEEANRFVENFSGMTFSGMTGKEWLKDGIEKMLAIAHTAGLKQGRAEENEACAKIKDDFYNLDRQCPPGDHHDDRYCSVCDSMKDAYAYADAAIRQRMRGKEKQG